MAEGHHRPRVGGMGKVLQFYDGVLTAALADEHILAGAGTENTLQALRAAVKQWPAVTGTTSTDLPAEPRRVHPVTEQVRMVQFVDKEKLRPVIAQAFEEMGIRGEPIGAEKVQAMIAACGVKPEENAFSQGIIEMREE